MAVKRVGVILNGVTGRMGRNQHLRRSIAAIRREGGVQVGTDVILPEPIALVGRDPDRLQPLAEESGAEIVSTDLDTVLSDPTFRIYFDAQATHRREQCVASAIAAGKAVYCEKPIATDSVAAVRLAELAERAGTPNGVVQDKLFLPGMLKLSHALGSGAIGRVLDVQVDFGYWVFEDAVGARQRPSWNYRAEEGGGIVLDMFCHFRYLFDHLFGGVQAVMCTTATHVPQRVDERGTTYRATADDAAYALVELAGGAICQVHASWCTRPYRDDLFSVHVDGTLGSAVAGLRHCSIQPAAGTPCYTWDPDIDRQLGIRDAWLPVPERTTATNAFRYQWEQFLRHVVLDEPFPWDLRDGARGVQFAEIALQSAAKRCWLDVPDLGR